MATKETFVEATGYVTQTTFWEDFSIAEKFGEEAVKDTFLSAFKEWKGNYIYLTELVMILNWKIYQHFLHDNKLAKIYNDLWEKADTYACNHLKGKELSYFYKITD